MIFRKPDGATPLLDSMVNDLIPGHIDTQQDLNRWEKANIAFAEEWASDYQDILSVWFIRELHHHMFNLTWKWAGQFRAINLNLGVNWPLINEEVKKLCDNTHYQIEHSIFAPDEIALRFHHKLVWIHPFINGNGRHARLIADLLIRQLDNAPFHWGVCQLPRLKSRSLTARVDQLQPGPS